MSSTLEGTHHRWCRLNSWISDLEHSYMFSFVCNSWDSELLFLFLFHASVEAIDVLTMRSREERNRSTRYLVKSFQNPSMCLTWQSNRRLHNNKEQIISCRRVDGRLWTSQRRRSQPLPRAACQNTTPISVTSPKCILLIGSIHPKCHVSWCSCNKPISCQLAAAPCEWRTVSAPAVQH